ncbi:MAG: peptide/nickel transport system substrate-binding protein [Rhodospirillaceae bacterium]|jgi:peptide/nickel transport system substrate-binding protein|nr:peptide/nickel transport system substrate-binding protein [Rhodospirillaceae bacterium]
MKKITISRREILRSAAAVATITALGIKPSQVLGAENGVLKSRMTEDIQVLDPGYLIGGTETSIIFATLPRLAVPVRNGDVWGWQPSESVEKVEQVDDTHIAFTLKPGLMWSDGLGELTAEDVKFSFERMLKTDWSSRWPTLDHVDLKDKYSGVIVLKSPFVATWLMGIASESGAIVPKAAVEKLKDGKFTTKLPGQLGPYRMTAWTPKQKVVLKANPDWHGTKPAFPEVHFIDIEETKAAELAFEAHEVAITSLTPATAARYKKSLPAHARMVNQPGPFFTWMGMNTQHEKLKDIRVRKAIQRAVDVDSILLAAYAGVSPKANGVTPIGILGHRPASKYAFNPDESRALLKEAGVSKLSLELKTLPRTERVAAAQIIQANLADVGIDVKVTPVDSGPFWNLGLESKGNDWKSLELWIMQYRTSPDPADGLQWFTKNQIGIWNWERWSNPEFEELWTKGLVEQDPKKRVDIYLRMQEIMEDTGAYAWITFDPLYFASDKNVIPGFDPGGEVRAELCRKA